MNKTFILGLIFLFAFAPVNAQKNLVLENISRLKRVLYIPGSPIRLQLKHDKIKVIGLVESVNDSMLVIVRALKMSNAGDATNQVLRDYILFSDIRSVYKRPSGTYGEYFHNMSASTLTLAGTAFSAILPIDAAVSGQSVNRTNFIIGLSMFATGLLLLATKKRKLKMGRKWKVKSMNPI